LTDQPVSFASVLSSIGAILHAVPWPAVAAWFLFSNRKEVSVLLKVFGGKLSSAKKLKFGQLELDEELEEAVSEAGAQARDTDTKSRTVPENQLHAALILREKVSDAEIPQSKVLEAVSRQILDLADQYDNVRKELGSGPLRTGKMNEIAAGMRTLALAGLPLRTQLTRSESVGRRLAAI
jgi:hypothetical protein